jgi:hypothetical protein
MKTRRFKVVAGEKIMNRFEKIACHITAQKTVKADYGDVPMYINIFDIFKVPAGLRDIYDDLQAKVEGAVMAEYFETKRRVVERLKRDRRLLTTMNSEGIEFK